MPPRFSIAHINALRLPIYAASVPPFRCLYHMRLFDALRLPLMNATRLLYAYKRYLKWLA